MKDSNQKQEATAAEAYAARQKDIAVFLNLIGQELKAHAAQAAKDPKNWGYACDMTRIREVMKEVLKSLVLDRFISEALAEKFIEERLQALRGKPTLYRHKGRLVTVPED